MTYKVYRIQSDWASTVAKKEIWNKMAKHFLQCYILTELVGMVEVGL